MACDKARNKVGCPRALSEENGATDGGEKSWEHSDGMKMGQRLLPWPGGVRLTAWASAASTDCSASPRRSRPLRDLG